MGAVGGWIPLLTFVVMLLLLVINGARWTRTREMEPANLRRNVEHRLNEHGSEILGLRARQHELSNELNRLPLQFDQRYASREVQEIQFEEIKRRLLSIEGMVQKL